MPIKEFSLLKHVSFISVVSESLCNFLIGLLSSNFFQTIEFDWKKPYPGFQDKKISRLLLNLIACDSNYRYNSPELPIMKLDFQSLYSSDTAGMGLNHSGGFEFSAPRSRFGI